MKENIHIIGNSPVKIIARRTPTNIFGGFAVIVDRFPNIYSDGFMLLIDRKPDEVKKWQDELLKRSFSRNISIKTIDKIMPTEKGKPLPKYPFAYEGKKGSVISYFEIDNEIAAVNAEVVLWLRKEGYELYYIKKNTPFRVERGERTVGMVAPIIIDEEYIKEQLEIEIEKEKQNQKEV